MKRPPSYLLDSDVLITAKNTYYAFDICPGFWNAILQEHGKGHVFSVSRVRGELMAGTKTEDLVQWVSTTVPASFFLDVDSDSVTSVFGEIMLWSQRHTRYSDAAKAKFATGADGWLVAFAKVHGMVVVTNEQPAPDSIREIKLPDVCTTFKVPSDGTFSMMRSLGVRLGVPASGVV